MRFLLTLFAFPLFGAAPILFYSDLVSGPNSGGESNNGLNVCVFGRNFGSTRGTSTVTVGGGAVAAYKSWQQGVAGGDRADDKACFQLGASAATGNIVMTTSGGTSNGLAFTVRSGNVYYASNSGSDGAAGTFAAPWATLTHARDTMVAGDTVYARTGSYLTTDDGTGYSTCMKISTNQQGSAGNPIAMVAYPGETVNLGDATNCTTTVRVGATTNTHYWVFANFSTVTGNEITFRPFDSHDWRLVGMNLTCPPGNGQSGCLDIGGDSDGAEHDYWLYGLRIHHAGTNNAPTSVTALYHGVYLSQQIHAIDFAWNTVDHVYGGRCIQQNVNANNAGDRSGSYDMHIHDNVIHDCQDDGIVMTTINPVAGTVELYNNVIYNAGIGPANAENSGAWACMNIQGWSNTGVTGESGVVKVYNNTMYACGTWSTPPYNGSSGGFLWEDGNTSTKSVDFRNNIIQLTTGPASGFPYFNVYSPNTSSCSSACASIAGSNNIFFGNGGNPTNTTLTGSINSDPLFTTAGSNFTLQSGSPARNVGTTVSPPTKDFLGVTRPQETNYAIGSYEFVTGGGGATGGTASGGKRTLGGKTTIQ